MRGRGARTIGTLTAINLLSAGLGIASTLVVAYLFGVGRSIEVFFAAVGLHASLVSLTQTGQLSEVLLPKYHILKQRLGRAVAYDVYTSLLNRVIAALLPLTLGAWLLSSFLARLRVPGFSPAEIALAAEMFRWIMPLLVVQVTTDLLKTLANAERLFGAPETVSLAARAVSLAAILVLSGAMGIWAMIAALWGAAIIELAGMLWLLTRRQYRYRLIVRVPKEAGSVMVFRNLATTFPYVSMTQVFGFVIDALLSQLPQGSFAVFRYATTIWARSQGIFLRPVSIPFFTQFSEGVARGASDNGAMASRAIAQVLAVSTVVTVGVLAGAPLVLTGLLEGDRFPAEQIRDITWLLGGFYVLLPIVGAANILRKVAVSLLRVREVYFALAVVQVISALLAWLLIPAFGLIGAWATTMANVMGFWLASRAVLKGVAAAPQLRLAPHDVWRWAVASSISLVFAWGLSRAFEEFPIRLFSQRIDLLLYGSIVAAWCVLVALVVSLMLGVEESRRLAIMFGRMLRSAARR